jgi:hypothetical protein
MRFLVSLAVLFLASAVNATADGGLASEQFAVAEVPELEPLAVEARDSTAEPLEKRACDYNGCKCNSRNRQFRSCGNCQWTNNGEWVISKKRVSNHIFECSPSGNCCDYGYAKDCGGSNARCGLND